MEESQSYIDNYGGKIWYLPSKGQNCWHRLDGPAFESARGSKEWWINNRMHRSDGPAIIRDDGTKFWYVNGKRHRLDGPSTEGIDGSKEWYIDGKELNTEEVEAWLIENSVDLKTPEGQMAFKLAWV